MLEIATENQQKLAYSVNEIAEMTSLSRSYLRNEIRAKKLKAKKVGTRVLILLQDLNAYLENQNDWAPAGENADG